MKIKSYAAVLIVLGVFVVGIIGASLLGFWNTEGTRTPERDGNGQAYNSSGGGGNSETSLQNSSVNVRGSDTFSYISSAYNIPLKDLAAAFGLSESEAGAFKCKDLGTVYEGSDYEIGPGSVKMFVAYYLGISYEPTEETYLSGSAVQILKDAGNLTQEQLDYIESHTVPES